MDDIRLSVTEATTMVARLGAALHIIRAISKLPGPVLWGVERVVGRPLFGWSALADDGQDALRVLTNRIDDWMDADVNDHS